MPRPVERFPVNIRPYLAVPRIQAPPAAPRAKAADGDAAAAGWRLLLLLAAAGTVIGFLLPLP